MKRFKFFHGYNVTIDMFDMESFATASIAGPDNPFWTNEMVERARLNSHFERARMLAQNDTDRMERRRLQIQADIQSRLRQHEEQIQLRRSEIQSELRARMARYEQTLTGIEAQVMHEAELRRQQIEERIEGIYTQFYETRWSRLKTKCRKLEDKFFKWLFKHGDLIGIATTAIILIGEAINIVYKSIQHFKK